MQKTIEIDLRVRVMVFLKSYKGWYTDDSGLERATKTENWRFGIKNKKFFDRLVNALEHIGRLDSDQYGLISLLTQARAQPPYSAFFH